MSEKLLRTEQMMSREDAAQKMRDLADRIEQGDVELKSGDGSVRLQPGDNVEFELEVEREADGDTSIEIEIEWPENEKNDSLEIG